jgi:hypothetical protein
VQADERAGSVDESLPLADNDGTPVRRIVDVHGTPPNGTFIGVRAGSRFERKPPDRYRTTEDRRNCAVGTVEKKI